MESQALGPVGVSCSHWLRLGRDSETMIWAQLCCLPPSLPSPASMPPWARRSASRSIQPPSIHHAHGAMRGSDLHPVKVPQGMKSKAARPGTWLPPRLPTFLATTMTWGPCSRRVLPEQFQISMLLSSYLPLQLCLVHSYGYCKTQSRAPSSTPLRNFPLSSQVKLSHTSF